eukprot:gb/GECG01005712.1/.p1 GENE.gb/GECG01005712.1/~~gb/GECG01005712.1/.p1  ORF type:complete len:803 (+),score=140.92 gb/GECG01005712.1/:1-2409(+)
MSAVPAKLHTEPKAGKEGHKLLQKGNSVNQDAQSEECAAASKDPFEEKLFKMLAAYGIGHLRQSLNYVAEKTGDCGNGQNEKALAALLNDISETAKSHSGKELIRGFLSDATADREAGNGQLNVSAVDPPAASPISPEQKAERQQKNRQSKANQKFRRAQLTSNYPFVDEEKSVMDDILHYPEPKTDTSKELTEKPQQERPSHEKQETRAEAMPMKKRYRVHRRPRQWNMLRRAISGETPPAVKDVHKINHQHRNTLAEEDRISYYSDTEVDAVYPKWWPSDSDEIPSETQGCPAEAEDISAQEASLTDTESEEEIWQEQGEPEGFVEEAATSKEHQPRQPTVKKRLSKQRIEAKKDARDRKQAAFKNKAKQEGTLDRIEKRKHREREAAEAFRRTLKSSATARERFLGIPRSKQQPRGNERRTTSSNDENSSQKASITNSEEGSRKRIPSNLCGVQSRIRDRVHEDRERYHSRLRKENYSRYYSPQKPDSTEYNQNASIPSHNTPQEWRPFNGSAQPKYSDEDQQLLAQAKQQYQERVDRLRHDEQHIRAKPGSISWTIPLSSKTDVDSTEIDIPTPPAQVARELRKQNTVQRTSTRAAKDFAAGFHQRTGAEEPKKLSLSGAELSDVSLKAATQDGETLGENIADEAKNALDTLELNSSPRGSPEAVQAHSAAVETSEARTVTVDPYMLQRQSRLPPPEYSLHLPKDVQSSKSGFPRAADNMKYVYGGEYMSETDRRMQTETESSRYYSYSTPLQIARGFLNGPVMAALYNKENSLLGDPHGVNTSRKSFEPKSGYVGNF